MNPQLNPPEPNIDKENPWAGDALQREECAKRLTQIIEGQTGPLTISVNGSWGTGKTFLLERWKAQLEKENYKVIYFNAWEDDFHQDPLLAIIGQLFDEILKGTPLKNVIDTLKQIKKSAGPILARMGFDIVTKKLELIGIDISSSSLEDIKTLQKYELHNEYKTYSSSKDLLRDELGKLANTICKDTGKPIIFIIDELDRCRPTFAIETLERVKHLFGIKNMIFVLGIAKESLEESIQSVYGNIDPLGYLYRFIDIEFTLPSTKNKIPFFNALWERFQIQDFIDKKSDEFLQSMQEDQKKNGTSIDENKLKEIIKSYRSEIKNFQSRFHSMLKWHEFTLRELKQCLKLFSLALQSFKGNHVEPIAIIILVILKIKFPQLYIKYLNGNSTPSEIANTLIPIFKMDDQDKNSACLFTVITYRTFFNQSYYTDFPTIATLFSSICELVNESEEKPVDEKTVHTNIFENPITSDFIKNQYADYINLKKNSKQHIYSHTLITLCDLWGIYCSYGRSPVTEDNLISASKKIDLVSIKNR